ncbi:MAG: hypothetical protein M0R46_01060 [Candidatus Muirbacterium halophilum]|nr:hypothetical protein [Candidatus Muirbacterium halophilum]MCK9474484.1 hypothetical protein [Candidatus Muirbacterium halophilum]
MKKTFSLCFIIITFLALLSGCGSSGGDDFGSNSILPGNITGNSNASTIIMEAKSDINTGTTSSFKNALEKLNKLESNPTYSPSPEEKLLIKTGIKYCEIQLDQSPIESTTTSSYLENIITSSITSGIKIPQDTYYILACSYYGQRNNQDAIEMMKNIGKVNGIFVPNFTYTSEFQIAKSGDAHALMALLYYINGDNSNAILQKSFVIDYSSIGADYLAKFPNAGL